MTANPPEHLVMQTKLITSSPRLGKPRDVANAYLFLAPEESDFMNGQVLSIDGGMLK